MTDESPANDALAAVERAIERVLAELGPGMTDRGKWTWLSSPSAYLGWRRPITLLESGEPREIAAALDAARAYAHGDPP